MVTISVAAEAFAAIEATLPKAPGSQSGREARPDGKGGAGGTGWARIGKM